MKSLRPAKHLPIHPGVQLRIEMDARGLTMRDVSNCVPKEHRKRFIRELDDLMLGGASDSCPGIETCLALDRVFGLRTGTWWHIQADYEAAEWAHRERWIDMVRPAKKKPTRRPRVQIGRGAAYSALLFRNRGAIATRQLVARRASLAKRLAAYASVNATVLQNRIKLLESSDARLLKKAVAVLESEESAANWLTSSIISLGGRAAVEVAVSEDGMHHVLTVLNSIEYGLGA